MAIILNINNLSAKVLGDVIHLSTSKIKFYVVVDISGGYRDVKEETPLAREEGVTNHPTWNCDMSFFVSGNECLYLKLYGKRPLQMDKFVGEVLVPMKVIMRNDDNSVGTAVTYPLYRKRKLRGEISFAYKFIRNIMDQDHANNYMSYDHPRTTEENYGGNSDPSTVAQSSNGSNNGEQQPPKLKKNRSVRKVANKVGTWVGSAATAVVTGVASEYIFDEIEDKKN